MSKHIKVNVSNDKSQLEIDFTSFVVCNSANIKEDNYQSAKIIDFNSYNRKSIIDFVLNNTKSY